jgi:hypothetical protein
LLQNPLPKPENIAKITLGAVLMREKSQAIWPEAFVSTADTTVAVSRAVKAGQLRKLASRLYTRNLTDAPENIVRRHLWSIVAGYFPGALIADRTAIENAPAADGSICLITDRGADIFLPGIVLRPRRGIAPLPTDRPYIGGLYLPSTGRSYLENMRPSRARDGRLPRTLSRMEVEERLDALIRRSGEEGVKRLRDEIRAEAQAMGLIAEANELDALIGTLLGTREAEMLSPTGRARRAGRPYDPDRLEMFQLLQRALRQHFPAPLMVGQRSPESQSTLAFFEAYFSNFIEGTEFEVGEAADIVFNGVIPTARPEDAHDVLGTWRLVSDDQEMRRLPATGAQLLDLLRQRHAAIMDRRPDKGPGLFKAGGNRVGTTVFVAPDLVEGTLEQGFALARSLESALQRAIFMMFLITEVHPFADGNGRTARIMMNAELVAADEQRIIIPTVYRNNYLAALRAMTQGSAPTPLIRTLDYAQRWTHAIRWGTVRESQLAMEACNAFYDPNRADQDGVRLKMPDDV